MTRRLSLTDLDDCFEGIIPSIIATASSDGMPNISYLSHVVRVGERHVALSNQFFGKTVANLKENPAASLILVDGATGQQMRLDVVWERNERAGGLFDEMAATLKASSAQIGMAEVMRLESVDVFRVENITALPVPDGMFDGGRDRREWSTRAAELSLALANEVEVATVVETLLDGLSARLWCPAVILFQPDPARAMLVTIASRGYPASGAGSEVPIGTGIAGGAAAARCVVKVSDMSRVQRFGAAIRGASEEEGARAIALPGLSEAQSQIGVPMIARGELVGVLMVESPERLAFGREAAAALTMVAQQAASALQLAEHMAGEPAGADEELVLPVGGPVFRVVHHGFDDSVFIDNVYVIKGVAGRLLVHLLRQHLVDGRVEFTNREIRLTPALRLPDFKDNLETRLLLLRQRLDERAMPVRLSRPGRGRLRLELSGWPEIESFA